MINILNGNWEQIADFIKREKKRMYFWGTGVMLQICMEQIVRDLDLWDCIGSVTDADIKTKASKVNANAIRAIHLYVGISIYPSGCDHPP